MNKGSAQSLWQRWLRQPKRLWFRKVLFQVHLWSGISVGLYIFFISVTGSVLVYRNELYEAFSPSPGSGEDFTPRQLTAYRLITKLIELHKELLAGALGRELNGIGAFAVLLTVFTGVVIWWPGKARWKRSLIVHRDVGWKRFVWELHNMVGFWSWGFITIFALSGIYLCFPETIHAIAERVEPLTDENGGNRILDRVLYWLAFLHFGRINGIGLFCNGPGFCDQSIKAVWALFGLAPAAMFVTGASMWWNRVLRRWWKRGS